MVGQPAGTVLPQVARKVLSDFLQSNGVASPKVALMMRHTNIGNGAGVSQDLAFNITPDNFGSEATYRTVMQQLAWFLPRHYSSVSVAENTLGNGFLPP